MAWSVMRAMSFMSLGILADLRGLTRISKQCVLSANSLNAYSGASRTMTTYAFTFPGQGSQVVGMGKELSDSFETARRVFEEVDEALGEPLSRMLFEGPQEDLTLTQNTQPALMAVSIAVVRVLEQEHGFKLSEKAKVVAGHSLGEYSALCAAGSIDLADTARLLRRRGEAMQRAVPVGEGAMAALLGLDFDVVAAVAAEAAGGDVCTIANDNSDGQVVVSGTKAAVERAIDIAKEQGARRGVLLPVSAPFHCPLMEPAADEMREALSEVNISAPSVPLVANITASETSDPAEIEKLLVDQVTGVVRWRESVLNMTGSGADHLLECGIGKVLTGLVGRIAKGTAATALHTPEDIAAFVSAD